MAKKKVKKAAKPPTVTIRLRKEEAARVREAAKKAGAKNVATFAKTTLMEKVEAVLAEKKEEA